MIGEVDNLDAAKELDAMTTEFEVKRVLKLKVEADKVGKASSLVARTHKVPVCVELGIREAGVSV